MHEPCQLPDPRPGVGTGADVLQHIREALHGSSLECVPFRPVTVAEMKRELLTQREAQNRILQGEYFAGAGGQLGRMFPDDVILTGKDVHAGKQLQLEMDGAMFVPERVPVLLGQVAGAHGDQIFPAGKLLAGLQIDNARSLFAFRPGADVEHVPRAGVVPAELDAFPENRHHGEAGLPEHRNAVIIENMFRLSHVRKPPEVNIYVFSDKIYRGSVNCKRGIRFFVSFSICGIPSGLPKNVFLPLFSGTSLDFFPGRWYLIRQKAGQSRKHRFHWALF